MSFLMELKFVRIGYRVVQKFTVYMCIIYKMYLTDWPVFVRLKQFMVRIGSRNYWKIWLCSSGYYSTRNTCWRRDSNVEM